MTEEKLEKIVIYHGSLAELNSRDENHKKYRFTEQEFFISERYEEIDEEDITYDKRIAKEILNKEYDGLVNARTIVIAQESAMDLYKIEGTPIKRMV